MKIKINQQKGFTIIELMIATAIFSVILLLATGAIIEIGKVYYKSIVQSKTQEIARSLSEEVTRSFQFSKANKIDVITPGPGPGQPYYQFCIGDTRYTYSYNKRVDPATPNVIGIKTKRLGPTDACAESTPANFGDKELLGKNMQLLAFEVNPLPNTSNEVYEIKVKIAHGENDLLTPYDVNGNPNAGVDTSKALPDASCKSNVAGSNFCAVSKLDNFVTKRLQ